MREQNCRKAASDPMLLATDLADYLVRKGATFREAHGAVGSLVRASEETGVDLADFPAERFTEAHALFGADTRDALGAEASLAMREVIGGTGPKAVAEQLVAAKASLVPAEAPRGNTLDAGKR